MISNKALVTLFFIPLSMQLVASTSPRGTKKRKSSGEPAPMIKKRGPATKLGKTVLQDTNSDINPVEVPKGSTEASSTPQELSIPQVNNQFKTLIKQGEYEKIFELGEKMNNEEFLKQLCPVIETPGQYTGIVDYLKGRKMVASFYVYGNIEVVKGVIIESKVYDECSYVKNGDLETALTLVLKEDRHNRVMELLDVRKGITAEEDEQRKRRGRTTSFEWFVDNFLYYLAPWKDGMGLKQFLTFRGNEFRHKHPDIIDTLCQELVSNLRLELRSQKAKELLIDLIGQSSLLTPMTFTKGFLRFGIEEPCSNFIKHAWRGAIEEGLKEGYEFGGEKLWRVLTKDLPMEFPRNYPPAAIELATVLNKFSTKHELEVQWIMRNVPDFMKKFNEFVACDLLPKVIEEIIFEYARPTWIDIPSIKSL